MGWQLEIAKMAFYMSFPVGCFHYFNQPEYFEKWVIQTRKDLYPPTLETDRRQFDDVKAKLQEAHEQKIMKAYEEQKARRT